MYEDSLIELKDKNDDVFKKMKDIYTEKIRLLKLDLEEKI